MPRINLAQLPKCGAITRKGTPCQRPGNKHNGRCRLHGGNSTGPTTTSGKAVSRHNASKAFPEDLFNGKVNLLYFFSLLFDRSFNFNPCCTVSLVSLYPGCLHSISLFVFLISSLFPCYFDLLRFFFFLVQRFFSLLFFFSCVFFLFFSCSTFLFFAVFFSCVLFMFLYVCLSFFTAFCFY